MCWSSWICAFLAGLHYIDYRVGALSVQELPLLLQKATKFENHWIRGRLSSFVKWRQLSNNFTLSNFVNHWDLETFACCIFFFFYGLREFLLQRRHKPNLLCPSRKLHLPATFWQATQGECLPRCSANFDCWFLWPRHLYASSSNFSACCCSSSLVLLSIASLFLVLLLFFYVL